MPASGKLRRGRDARAIALEAASEIFAERGFDDTSMDAVSLRAGVSKATLYAHYGDKIGLFTAFMDRARQLHLVLDGVAGGPGDLEDRLTALVAAVIEATTSEAHVAYLRIIVWETRRAVPRYESPTELPHGVEVAEELLRGELGARGLDDGRAADLAASFIRMSAAPMQLDALLHPGFRPHRELIELQARWATRMFLTAAGLSERDADAPLGQPPEASAYPWVRSYP